MFSWHKKIMITHNATIVVGETFLIFFFFSMTRLRGKKIECLKMQINFNEVFLIMKLYIFIHLCKYEMRDIKNS